MLRQITNLVVIAAIGFAAYSLWNWQSESTGDDEAMRYAEVSCIDAIRSRFDVENVRSNSVRPNEKGYVVRASMTLRRGDIAKATCLTNPNGTVEDVFVEER
ncbi:MAG: hypothetical protein GTO71_03000 [Woeseiaceae bacterium]|nr:hypothetical protein [Woeseiaceae bacterium]NIP20079.1 hypothetical protein [Woeseiaceae bacterium]NIS88875.1 hypothetical protein [Woeseiaceae bacterium]